MRIIILCLSILLHSCFKQTTKKDQGLQALALQQACTKACYYEYETFKSLKEVNEDSLSLSLKQITGFHENCLFFCSEQYPANMPKVKPTPAEKKPENSPKPKVKPKIKKKVPKKKDFQTFEELEGL